MLQSQPMLSPVRPRILIVDDDRLVLATLQAGLTRAGYDVQAVSNGHDALAACHHDTKPDLIVLDYNMPGLNGLEVTRKLRDQGMELPILILSACDEKQLVQEANIVGVNGFFVKPVESNQLVPSIELNLARSDPDAAGGSAKKGRSLPHEPNSRDSDTSLLNLQGLQHALDAEILDLNGSDACGTCFCLDIHHLHEIAECLDQSASVVFINRIICTINKELHSQDHFAHVGFDQFFIVRTHDSPEQAQQFAETLVRIVNKQSLSGDVYNPRLSINVGYTVFACSSDTDTIIAQAYSALFEAKLLGKNTINRLQSYQQSVEHDDVTVESMLPQLNNELIDVVFQPILDIRTNKISHYEALIRLKDKNDEIISIGQMMNAAEKSGLIRLLDYRVLEMVITQLAAMEYPDPEIIISINISGIHFGAPGLFKRISKILEESVVDPSRLLFEITETSALQDIKQARNFIAKLKSLGCQFAIDDFGAGYGSFHYLKELPVDYIKIDGSFICDLSENSADKFFVKAIVDVAKGLGVKTIAEYVTNADTLALLASFGVDYAQGFYIGKPAVFPLQGNDE